MCYCYVVKKCKKIWWNVSVISRLHTKKHLDLISRNYKSSLVLKNDVFVWENSVVFVTLWRQYWKYHDELDKALFLRQSLMVNFSVPVHSSFKCTLSPKSLKALFILSEAFGCIWIASLSKPSNSMKGSTRCFDRLTMFLIALVAADCKILRRLKNYFTFRY